MATATARVVGYTLRDERVEDEPFLVELYRSLHQEIGFRQCSLEQQRQIIAFGRDLEKQTIEAVCPTATGSIIVVDGEPAGEIIVERTRASIRLIEIAIATRFQGQGIGTDLVSHLCEEAADRGVPLRLRVAVDNAGARKLYERLGFLESEADEKYIDLVWRRTSRVI